MNINPEQLGQIVAAQVEAFVSARVDQAMQELDYKISAAAEDAWRQHEVITHEDDAPPENHPFRVTRAGGLDVDVADGNIFYTEDTATTVSTSTITLSDNATSYIYLRVYLVWFPEISFTSTDSNGDSTGWDLIKCGKDSVSAPDVVVLTPTPSDTWQDAPSQTDGVKHYLVATVTTAGGLVTNIDQYINHNHYAMETALRYEVPS